MGERREGSIRKWGSQNVGERRGEWKKSKIKKKREREKAGDKREENGEKKRKKMRGSGRL